MSKMPETGNTEPPCTNRPFFKDAESLQQPGVEVALSSPQQRLYAWVSTCGAMQPQISRELLVGKKTFQWRDAGEDIVPSQPHILTEATVAKSLHGEGHAAVFLLVA